MTDSVFPFVVIDKNNTVINYSSNFEIIWNEFSKLNIKNIASFLLKKYENKEYILNTTSSIYFLKVLEGASDLEFYFIDVTSISYKLENYIDVNSFLHDLKNPLSIIDGVAQLLETKKLDNYLYKCISIIKNEVERIKRLLDDFKFITNLTIDLEDTSITLFINELISSLSILYPVINFKVYIDPFLDKIKIDKQKLYRAFYNIVKNACEARENGVITISAFIEPFIKYIDKKQKNYIKMIKFNIVDHAGGINDKIRDRIFTPFFTTKSKGSGLGLSIAREIIEKHNGKLEFRTTPGIGTTFTILLPL